VPSALHEILAPILADLAVNKVETGSFFGDADESKAAQEELQRRGINYSYGGDSTLGSLLLPLRREVISPEQNRQIGEPYLNEKGQVTYQVQNIPAEYGKAEFGMEYIPVVRGARSVRSAARDFFLGDAKEQASVARSALNMVEGFGQHIAEQVQAFGSGGQYYDPKQERIVEADPTLVMFGGNPATTTGKVLGSGVRLPSGGKKRAYEQYGGNLEDARNKLNLTDEYRKEWQKTRSGFKQERPEELKIAAQKVSDGEMTFEEYRALVQEVLPPEPLGQLMDVPTLEEIALSLDKSPDRTAGIIGLNIDIPDGTPASSRLDISAYEDQGTWVNTIHEGGKKSGTVLGYGPTTVLNNVSFSSNPKQALEIAKGQGKTPIARIDGTWENRDPKIVEQQVRSILDGTAPDAGDWVEVGMNPIRGSGFYNKATFELVDDAEQILQVGPLVLAKKVNYRKPNDPKNQVEDRGVPRLDDQGDPIFFSGNNKVAGSGAISALRDITGETPEVTRDTTLLERVLDVDSVNNMNPVWGEPELRSVPIARASDLEDRAYMTGITDTTDSSLRNLISLDGVPIDEKMRGGTFFGFQPEQMELGQAFASADGAIQSQINRARKAQQLSGREGVIFAPHGMTPSSPDFATMPTNIAVKYSRAMMEPKDKKLLDERIRNGVLTKKGDKYAAGKEPIPDWMGIDNVTDEYLASIGGKRKNVTRALDEFREAGALNLSQSRALVTDPSQFNKDWGMVNSMYLLDPKSGQTKPRSTHPSYPAALTGVPIGATTEGFSILDWNPTYKNNLNFIDEMMRKGREAGQEYIDIKKLDDGTVGFQRDKIQPKIQNIKRFDIPNRERPVIGGRARTAGSGLAGSLKSGGQGLITREMIDDLIARGLILSD
tara:strand:+ start:461 stop:3121 length:2661 start_codon:yes stop_codon:yes gene_type:complete